jgi:hypothetical protein
MSHRKARRRRLHFRQKKEELVMKLTILIIIAALGLLMPLLWITGTLTSVVYFCMQKVGATRKERTVAFDPQLGLTMADGGDSIDKEGKK